MGPMAIRAQLARTNQRLLTLVAVLVLAGSVVVHHGAPHQQMGGMHGDHQVAAAAMCVGTIASAIAIVGLIATVVRRRRGVPRPVRALPLPVSRVVPTVPLPRARSSPLYLQYAVFRL